MELLALDRDLRERIRLLTAELTPKDHPVRHGLRLRQGLG
jgi:hypothetical protein